MNIDEPKNQGCPCVALNAERKDAWGGHRGNIDVSFTQGHNQDIGSTNFCTAPNFWNGTTFRIPISGLYYTSINFVRQFGHEYHDHFALQLIHNNGPVIGSALALANQHRDAQTGHYNLVTRFDHNDELKLRTWSGKPDLPAEIRAISWSLFHLCCDSNATLPPC